MVRHTNVVPPFPDAPDGVKWQVFHFLTGRGENIIREWLDKEKVPPGLRGALQNKINALEFGGPRMVPGFIRGPVAKEIYKATIYGQVQLRPRLCHGPYGSYEFTFLFGAIEKNNKDTPDHCNASAQENRIVLKADKARRKRERITR